MTYPFENRVLIEHWRRRLHHMQERLLVSTVNFSKLARLEDQVLGILLQHVDDVLLFCGRFRSEDEVCDIGHAFLVEGHTVFVKVQMVEDGLVKATNRLLGDRGDTRCEDTGRTLVLPSHNVEAVTRS